MMNDKRLALILASFALGLSMRAHASPLTPVQCSGACPQMQAVPFQFIVGGQSTTNQTFELPNYFRYWSTNYTNNLNHSFPILGNPYIGRFDFHFTYFNTEPQGDKFYFGIPGGTTCGQTSCGSGFGCNCWSGSPLSGDLTAALPSWIESCNLPFVSLASNPMTMQFTSTNAFTYDGFRIEGAQVCCNTQIDPNPPYILPTFTRAKGVFLDASDVVTFRTPSTNSSLTNMVIVAWSDPQHSTYSNDVCTWNGPVNQPLVQIYAKCDSAPTSTDTHSIISSSPSLSLQAATCPSGYWWVSVVSSYSNSAVRGPSAFDVMVTQHAAGHEYTLTVGTGYAPTQAQKLSIQSQLTEGAKAIFSASKGMLVISKFNIYPGDGVHVCNCAGQTCQVCFEDVGTNQADCVGTNSYTRCDATGDHIYMCPNSTGHDVLRHELSHFLLENAVCNAFAEEYITNDGFNNINLQDGCAHTIMSDNFQIFQNNYCNNLDHALDAPNVTTSNNPSDWQGRLQQVDPLSTAWPPANITPDDQDMACFGFDGTVGAPVYPQGGGP
jgi:hypothetical protein